MWRAITPCQRGKLERQGDYRQLFHWTLEAFSSLDLGVGGYCHSPMFSFYDSRWMLKLYPNTNQSGWIGLRLLYFDLERLTAQYSVGIRTEKGGTVVCGGGTKTFLSAFNPACCRVMKRSELLRRGDELLPNDTLTLMLQLTVANRSSGTEPPVSFSTTNLESLSLDLSKLLEDQVLPDVKLKCAERTFSAHRAVLAARSEVFAAMFRSNMSESETGVVEVTDLDASVLYHFLRYIYTGKMEGVPEDMVPVMYAACDKYAVHSLKAACSHRMIAGLTEGNCVSFLTVADAHSDASFREQVVSFICGHEAILLTEVWSRFRESHKDLANEVYDRYFRRKSRTSVEEPSQPEKRRKSHHQTELNDRTSQPACLNQLEPN